MKNLITCLVVCVLSGVALAQTTGVTEDFKFPVNNMSTRDKSECTDCCGTELTPEVIKQTQRMLEDGTWDEARSQDIQNRGTQYVKITVHIVRYSNGTGGIPISRITNSINDLNTHVASTGLEFFIHGDIIYLDSDEYAECTSGESDALRQINPVTGSANIWFVPICPDFCGRSSFPFSPVQGTIMANDCVDTWWNDSTFSHELGHYFHLFHTHETYYGAECVNGSNCSTSGDLICDTSADPNLSGLVNDSCFYTGTEVDPCGSGQQYDPPTLNLMSYSQKLCRDFFTNEQLSMFLWSAENDRQNHLTDYNTGACCSASTCIETYQYLCEDAGWSWQGLGTACVDGCLQNELGACCVGTAGGCIDNLSELDCLAGSGTWLGPDFVCADGDCTECTDPCDPECDVYDPCVCDPESCSNGACCLNENCSIMTGPDCAASGGSFLGDGSNCQANPCINGILNVPGDFPTIQAAVDAAIDGDEILVMPGIYNELINFNGKNIVVVSQFGPLETIIDGALLGGTVVRFENGEGPEVVLDGFTITNGSAEFDAGGIYCLNSDPTIKNCLVKNNAAIGEGGGIYLRNSNTTLTNCTFENNSASDGGGMYNFNSSLSLENCTFTNNTADVGGGMYNYQSNPTLTDCIFTGNVTYLGSGMYNTESSPILENCTFTENTAAYEGGGMTNINSSHSSLTNCIFTQNTSERGGGMNNITNSSPTVTDCTFTSNIATIQGGGMYNLDNSNPTLENCTFTGNTANLGGGMHNQYECKPTLIDCTIKNNTAELGGGIYNNTTCSSSLTGTTVCGNMPNQISGYWTDNGGNTIEDKCPIGCPDINGDGYVDVSDLLTIIDHWGQTDSPADVNFDGIVDVSDLLIVVGNWGPCQLEGAVQWTIEEGGNDHWYLVDWLPTEPTSWSDLNQHAISLGGHLVTILSAEENYFVINLMESLKENHGWTGLSAEANTNNWQWVTGESVDFTSWGGSNCGAGPYPNDSENGFRFVLLNNRYMDCGWNWDDFDGGHPLNFPVIIEWSN